MKTIREFQKILRNKKINAYIIPTADYHQSEYVSDFFKGRAFLSGFTGSAGTLIVTQDKAYLWTDGRYHIQAAKQIEGKPITLMKQGQPEVPDIYEFLQKELKPNDVLAFDGKVLATSVLLKIQEKLPQIKISYEQDLMNEVWNDRPSLPFTMIYRLEDYYAGEPFSSKINRIRAKMKEQQADVHIISSLEDQAWIYNLRANDVLHTPVFLAYTIITEAQCHLFVDLRKVDRVIEKYLKDNQVILHPYEEFYDILSHISSKNILVDYHKINTTIYYSIQENNTLINATDPSLMMKCIKNENEIKNTIHAHIKDGIAFTKFMYFIKKNIGIDHTLTELTAADYLAQLRAKQQSFVDLSFETICAYKEHGAMMHYSATKETASHLLPTDFLLVDSGGHYLDGTTDITRTIALGPLTSIQKEHFTTVLKSVIALSEAIFLKGVRGINLDILARGPIWKEYIDYKCGTGHGVGNLLSVHEAPNGFRWQVVPERNDSAVLEPGMITTNEPGIYLENKYGIRIENEMLCVEKNKTEFGEFLGFETITYAPIDLDAICVEMLNKNEKEWLNQYHKKVYDTLSPYLENDEKEWLEQYTKEI